MPYDMITPYGPSAIGVLSDDERMARQSASQRALAFQAQAAQEGLARRQGAAAPEEFGADPGPSRETLRSEARNDMVDLRQQSTRAAQDRANIDSGIPEAGGRGDIGDWRGLQTAKIGGELQNENQLNAIREKYTALMNGGAGGAAAKPPEQNALVGGANPPGAGANSDAEENRLTELALLGTRLNGGNGQMPDIAGMFNKRADRKATGDRNAIELKALELKMAEAQRSAQEAEGLRQRAAGKPNTTGATLPRVDAESLQSRPEFARALSVALDEAKLIAGKNYVGMNFTPEHPLPDESKLPMLVDAAAAELVKLGVDPAEAKSYVLAQLSQQFGADDGGLEIPYVRQRGGSAVSRYLKSAR